MLQHVIGSFALAARPSGSERRWPGLQAADVRPLVGIARRVCFKQASRAYSYLSATMGSTRVADVHEHTQRA
jgi:hypothetical protein